MEPNIPTPNKITYPEFPKPSKFNLKENFARLLTWRSLMIMAMVVVIGELIWGAYVLTRPIAKRNQAPSTVYPMASINLESTKTDLSVGETIQVDIVLSTGGKRTDGVDMIINFDPNKLEVIQASGSGGLVPVKVNNLYSEYPINKVDDGKVVISGINNPGTIFSGNDIFGTLNFRAKSAGKTSVGLEFTSGSTTDSNVMESGTARDILIYTKGIDFNIK